MASKSTQSPVGAAGYVLGVKRTDAEWDALARKTIIPALAKGATMNEMRAKYGSGRNIRRTLSRLGYDTKGRKVTIAPLSVKGNGAATAKRIAQARQSGDCWDRIVLRTGMTATEARQLLVKHGYADVATGRVIISAKGKAKLAKAQAEAAKPKARRTKKVAAKA